MGEIAGAREKNQRKSEGKKKEKDAISKPLEGEWPQTRKATVACIPLSLTFSLQDTNHNAAAHHVRKKTEQGREGRKRGKRKEREERAERRKKVKCEDVALKAKYTDSSCTP